MKKIFIILTAFLCIICVSGCGKQTKKEVIDNLYKKIEKTKGYKLDAKMNLVNNDDVYKYDITVSYKKPDYYRVSLRNKTNNHEQIILKNKGGVYVLTPSLNKSFKFQSNWPYNGSQSYLLKSVAEDLKKDDKSTIKKKNNMYILKSKVNYRNNVNLKYQVVKVGKDYNIKSVYVYDKNDVCQIKVDITSLDMNAKFKNNYFSVDENMDVWKSENKSTNQADKEDQTSTTKDEKTSKELEEAVYPMYLPEGTYLETEKNVDLEEGSRIIMTFSGKKPFMLVEQTAVYEDEFSIIPTSGELDMLASTVAVVDDSSVSFINDDVEYYLVSNDLSKNELLKVAKSLSVMPVGK